MASVTRPGGAASDFAVADDAARERGRLRESEAQIVGQVVEFQLARQRAELVMPEVVEPLSPREREVLGWLAVGRTDGEIADALFISKKTASVHVANIKGKLGAANRVEIALIAERLGLVAGTGDGGSDGSAATAWAVARAGRPLELCPFKGLAPFESSDARFYFGRERLVANLVARMVGATLLAVVGPSGSGKSSAVRAGLLPAVAGGVLPGSETWPTVLVRPGAAPLATLRNALHDSAKRQGIAVPADATIAELQDRLTAETRLLVTVDQFEESFTLCPVEAERSAFIDALVALANDPAARTVVVLVIRADFYGRCAAYPGLARLLGEATILVSPPTADEIERAIEAPARAAHLSVEPQLTADLIRDVTGQPGALPLLSTTLLDLWSRRDGKVLRVATYEQIGGVSGAVARLAEAAYGRLNDEQQEVARGVLLRLASTGEGNVVVRRPAPLAAFDTDRDANVRQVLAVLADARLITVDDGSVEVAHEALLRDWPRFSDWLESDREGRRLRDHLVHAAREWQDAGEDAGELLRGARLAATSEWADGHAVELNALERRYLAASRSAAEREIVRERRVNRRLRWLLVGTVGLLVVALVTGSFALVQLDRAESEAGRATSEAQRAAAEARRAEEAATVARSRELTAASISTLGEDPSLSKLLAVAAAEIAPPDVALENALHRAIAADATVDRYVIPDGIPIGELVTDLHPDGQLMVASGTLFSGGDAVALIDLASDEVVWEFAPPDGPAAVANARFSPDGKSVIAATSWEPDPSSGDGPPPPDALGVMVLDARTGRVTERFDAGRCGAQLHAVAQAVVMIEIVAEEESTPACFADPDAGHELETLDLASGRHSTLTTSWFGDGVLSRDGRFAAFNDLADGDRSRVVDLATRESVMALERDGLPQGDREVRALNADGSLLLYGDRPMMVYKVATGAAIATLAGDEGEHYGAEFAPEGTIAYTSGRDETLRVWDAEVGGLLFEAPAAGAGRPSATTDGRVLVGDFTDGVATLLDLMHSGEADTIETCRGFVPAGQFQVVGDTASLLAACSDGTNQAQVADMRESEVLATIPGAYGQDMSLSPDGTRIVAQTKSGSILGPLQVYDARSGEPVVRLEGICDWDEDLFMVPRWEAGPTCKPFPETPFAIWSNVVEFSPDGRWVLLKDDPGIAIWDAESGALVRALTGFTDYVRSAIFTPDSSAIIVNMGGDVLNISTSTWSITPLGQLDRSRYDVGSVRFVGFLPDGTLIGLESAGPGGGSLLWIDPHDARVLRSVRAHVGSPKSFSLSLDRTQIVTGASDGSVRVWDAESGDLLHDLRVSGQAQGVAFLGEDRVAVTPENGNIRVFLLDPDALVDAAKASLTRSFTPEECDRFGFDDTCPTLKEMRGSLTDSGG